MEPRTRNILIISAIGVVLLGVVAYFIYKAIPASSGGGAPPTTTTTTNPGIIDSVIDYFTGGGFQGLFGGGKPKTTSNSGYTTIGNCVDGCDSGAPGRDCDGFLSTQC